MPELDSEGDDCDQMLQSVWSLEHCARSQETVMTRNQEEQPEMGRNRKVDEGDERREVEFVR